MREEKNIYLQGDSGKKIKKQAKGERSLGLLRKGFKAENFWRRVWLLGPWESMNLNVPAFSLVQGP